MTDMVEKVVRALIEADPAADARSLPMPLSTYKEMARAAIRALMEPTEEMLKAGRKPLASGAIGEDIVWQAMLKAALDD